MLYLTLYGLLILVLPTHWHVKFQQDYSNTAVEFLVECKAAHFTQQISVGVGVEDEEVDVEKPKLPKGRCTAIISVLRNIDPIFGDPKDDYVGESIVAVVQH